MHSGGKSFSIQLRNIKDSITYGKLVVFIAALFSIIFSFYSILKAYTINAYGWDLGLYSQAFYSTLHGKLFYTNLAGGSYLAEHFSPFMFAILPLFYLYPSPYILLVLQSIFISFASIPLYYLSLKIFSKYRFNNRKPEFYAFIISIAFILSPLTESPVYFDFHIMIFLPFFYFMAVYFYLEKRIFLNILFLALIVSLHSSFIFIVIMTILMELILFLRNNSVDRKNIKKLYLFSSAGIIILLIYYVLAALIKGNISNSSSIPVFVSGQSGSASRNLEGLLITMIYHPVKFLNFIVSNYEIKILFLVLAFMSLDFISFDFPIGLLPAIPYLAYAMTSSYIPYYFMGYQYSMMFIPFVFVAGIFGIEKLMISKSTSSKLKKHKFKNLRNTFIAITAFAIASFIVISPISPISVEPSSIHSIYSDSTGYREMENHFIYSIAGNIDMNASLVTGNSLYPLFYKDLNATAFPYGNISIDTHYKYIIANFNDDQTYLKDGNNISLSYLAMKDMNDGSYSIFAEGYGIIALEYNYKGTPVLQAPFSMNYSNTKFNTTDNTVYGPFPDKGISEYQKLKLEGDNIYMGNSTYLLPGNYTFSFQFNTTRSIPDMNITVYSNYGKNIITYMNNSSEIISGDTVTVHITIDKIYTGVLYKINNMVSGMVLYRMSIFRSDQ